MLDLLAFANRFRSVDGVVERSSSSDAAGSARKSLASSAVQQRLEFVYGAGILMASQGAEPALPRVAREADDLVEQLADAFVGLDVHGARFRVSSG
jgi:hypothetical protein